MYINAWAGVSRVGTIQRIRIPSRGDCMFWGARAQHSPGGSAFCSIPSVAIVK